MSAVLAPRPLSFAEKVAITAQLMSDYPLYAQRVLRIRPKEGGAPQPFVLNDAQRHLHAKIEEQRQSIGRVRAIVLKGRQQGVSTYTEGRFYHRLSYRRGVKAYILTHEQKATDNLFGMVQRFWEHAPAGYRPHLGASNAKQLVFDAMGSSYEVATAGSKDTGRSGTAQYLHGSEVAFWQHADDHMAGLGQVVPDAEQTEVILESTANGTANVFHDLWQKASRKQSEYMPVFIPWFWQREYRRTPGYDFELSKEESEYQDAFSLDLEQMAWRRNKIATDFRGDASLFDQEYPGSAELAFAASSPRALIRFAWVAKARRTALEPEQQTGPRIWGLDPAEYGDDDSSLMQRHHRIATKIGSWHGLGTMQLAGEVGVLYDKIKASTPALLPDVINVDSTGIGTGVADRLKEEGYPVQRVHFGEAARDREQADLVRDEMWGDMADWLQDSPCSIPDDDDLGAQLCAVQYSYDSKRRRKMEPKEAMKKRGLRSPDDADALALTFHKGSTARSGDVAAFRRAMGYQ